jgi:hypothetical protein
MPADQAKNPAAVGLFVPDASKRRKTDCPCEPPSGRENPWPPEGRTGRGEVDIFAAAFFEIFFKAAAADVPAHG